METKEIVRIIEEEIDEVQLNDVIGAACRAFNRVNQDNDFVFIALPKHNVEKRKQVIQEFFKMAEISLDIL